MRAFQSRSAFNEIHIGFRWSWLLGDSDFDQPSSSLVANVSLSLLYKGTGRIRVSKYRKNLRAKKKDRKGVSHFD